MTLRAPFLLTLAVATACAAGPAAAQEPEPAPTSLRFFFVADMHSRHAHMDLLLEHIARERPDLVVDGGDLVHDGTEAELLRAFADRARAGVPWLVVRGNHDALLRGPFRQPPPAFPAFDVAVHGGVRFILLDNHEGLLDGEQFAALEDDLATHGGARTIVVMHVPAFLEREPAAARLRHLLPFRLAEPAMIDAAQVERFTALMERHRVLAVLAGHTHAYSSAARGGVPYIVAGAAGGLTPGLRIPAEYLDVTIDGDGVRVTRVVLRRAAGDPFTFVARAFGFYAALNDFNHRELGWTFVPSASVQLRTGLVRLERQGTERPLLSAVASFERMPVASGRHSFLADAGLLAGRRDAALTLAAGGRVRPVGSWNRNLHVLAGVNGNGGVLAGGWTAGVGVNVGAGIEWHGLAIEVGGSRATNYRATGIIVGRRF